MNSCDNTGYEPSPKGRGKCAENEKINTVMKGSDGKMWIVLKDKTGSKRWIRKSNKLIK